MNSENWQLWQYFLMIAEQGSLNRAADQLGVSQPTLSRQLAQLEKQLGQLLFDRSTQGLTLTSFGARLLEDCQQMQRSSDRLQRIARGQDQDVAGRIRVSVNEIIAQYYLPVILPAFLRRYPQLSVEVEVSNRLTSIDKRDADIAIRMVQPTQQDLVARRLFEIPLGFYASQGYLAENGTPASFSELTEHRLLGYDRDKQFEHGAKVLGWELKNEDFMFRTDFMPMHLALAKQGGGIVAGHKAVCESLGLTEIELEQDIPALPVYLVCHRDVQHNKKIRVTMDFLAENLTVDSV